MNDVRSQDFKTGKILVPLKEFNILEGTLSYEINGIAEKEVTYFYRQEYKSFKPMPKGEYSLVTSGDNVTITLKTNVYQDGYREIQICETINLKSSKYEPSGDVDINTVLAYLNNVSEDMANVFRYVKAINTIMDTSSGSNTLSKLTPNTTWYMDNDGIISSLPVKELFDGFNAMVEQVRLKVLEMLRDDLTQAEIELLRRVKAELDIYVENDLKTRLDDYTTALEKRLQVMIDQAVGDKGLMPNNSDWFEVEFGNWLIVDLFNKNYLHYPPNLNSDDNNGVFKKDITDSGRTQVIRYYTTTGKLLFVVKVNDVWSEWQEVGGNTGSMQFTQANHGFIFTPVTLDGTTKQWKKATRYTGADGIAVMVDNDKFDLVLRGVVNIPTSARDDKGQPFIYDEYYFLSQDVDGGFSKDKNLVGLFQNLIHVSELDGKQVAYVNIGDPINLDYEVLDSESANRIGIATYKTTLRKADTIDELKKLDLKLNDVIEVLGYYSKDDGATHKRVIASEDDGSGVQLNNGLWANIVHNGEVNVSWLGAKGDGVTDSSEVFDKCIKLMNNKHYCSNIIVDGQYYISKSITVNGALCLKGFTYPARRILSSNKSDNVPLSIIKVEANVTAFVVNGFTGDTPTDSDGKIFLRNIVFTGTSKSSNLIEWNINGGPSRGSQILECEFSNFDKVISHYIPEEETSTSVINFVVKRNDIYSNNYFIYTPQDKKSGFMYFVMEDNTCEWGSRLFTKFYFADIRNNLIEGTENFCDIKIYGNSTLNFINNYTEANSGKLIFRGLETGEQKHIYGYPRLNLIDNTGNSFQYSSNIEIIGDIYYNRQDSFTNERERGTFLIPSRISFAGVKVNNYTIKTDSSLGGNVGLECAQRPNFKIGVSYPNFMPFATVTNDSNLPDEIQPSGSDSGINGISVMGNEFSASSLLLYSTVSGYKLKRVKLFVAGHIDKDKLDKKQEIVTDSLIPTIWKLNDGYDVNTGESGFGHDPKTHKLVSKYDGVWFYSDGTKVNSIDVSKINTPYYATKMQQEGLYDDFISYMDEKVAYDKQQEKLEQDKMLAYEEELKQNPNLTYEEFISSFDEADRMMLPEMKEPQPSEALKKFMEKYL